MILYERYYGFFRGHFSKHMTSEKILQVGYYWPIIFQDSFKISHKYEKYNKFIGRRKATTPLNPRVMEEPFQQ